MPVADAIAMAVPTLERPLETDAEREHVLAEVRRAATAWREGPLCEGATQMVFGVGPATAGVMLVGEAPGYQEDLQGVPFIGPAGELLDEGLAQAGLRRDQVYLTNVVKHRPWEPSGPRGRNRAPRQSEIALYRPWLELELAIVRPQVVGCLGSIAACALLGKHFRLMEHRGKWFASEQVPHLLPTIHPGYAMSHQREGYWRRELFEDLRRIGEQWREPSLG